MSNNREEITSLPMGQLFVKMALPGIMGTLILGLYNLVDGIFVGRIIGPEALGGVTLVYSVVLINQAFLVLLGSGSMAVLSIAVGKKDNLTINRVFGNLVILLGALSLVFSVVVYIGAEQILTFLGGSGLVQAAGSEYLRIISAGFILAALGPAINMLIRGEGNIKNAMKILSVGVLLNILLDYLLISLFDLGIRGAAIATVTSQGVVLLLNLGYLKQGKSVISLSRSEYRISGDLLPKVLSIGSSSMILMLMASLQQLLLFKAIAALDNGIHVPLLGAAYRILIFAVLPFAGIGQGLQSVIGINYGAGKVDRVKEAFKFFTGISTFLAFILWTGFMLFPGSFLTLMLKDPALVHRGIPYFRMFLIAFPFIGLLNCSAIFFQALGKGKKASMVNILRQAMLFIPLILIFPQLWGFTGVWLSMPVADLTGMVAVLFIVRAEYIQLSSESYLKQDQAS